MSQGSGSTRRTGNARTRGRAATVVGRVVRATADELGRVGYAALRIEDVATRSGVHKTTIYRRWPTKPELVSATILAMMEGSDGPGAIDTGTVRGDLRASLLSVLELTPTERGILRIMQLERGIPEVNALAQRFRDAIHGMRLAMVERGVARGELPKDVDADLIVDLVSAPVQRALLFGERVDPSKLDRVLDVVLAGAAACAAGAEAGGTRRRVSKGTRKARGGR